MTNKKVRLVVLSLLLIGLSLPMSAEGCLTPSDKENRIVDGVRSSALPIEMTYLGNCGFLVRAGGKKILFDLEGPDEAYSKLAANLPPFDGIDAVLISHSHGDHINPAKMLESLSKNTILYAYTTVDTREEMKKSNPSLFAGFENRVVAVDPSASGTIEKTIAGMNVEFLGFYHGGETESGNPLPVLGIVVNMNGTRFFYLSDVGFADEKSVKTLKNWALKNETIDWLLCHWGLLIENPYTANEILGLVKTSIRPARVVPMHIVPELFTFDQVEAKTKERYPQVFVFRTYMEAKNF